MSDEEKKAIKEVKHFNQLTRYWQEEEYEEKEIAEYITTVLNLIEKQQIEIKHQKEKIENQKKELAILNEKQEEFNKLVNTVNSYKGQYKRQQKEIEELREDKKKWEKVFDIGNKRKYKSKYLEEKRKENDNLLYPDSDEIYEKYYQQKDLIEKQSKEIEELIVKNHTIKQENEYLNCVIESDKDNYFNKNVVKDLIDKTEKEYQKELETNSIKGFILKIKLEAYKEILEGSYE